MTDNACKNAIDLINSGEKRCVAVRDGKIISAESPRGIAHIIKLYEDGTLKGSFVADTIIGKAAAMIFTLAGVSGCYGKTMSRSGLSYLRSAGISAEYETLTDSIQNRRGDGICPMEFTVMNINDPQQALLSLKNKVEELKKAQN